MKKLPADAPLKLVDALAQSHTVLANYFYKTNASPYYVWAALLDPRLASDLEMLQDDAEVRAHIRICMESLREHYVKNYVPSSSRTPSSSTTPAATAAVDGSPVRDFTARFRRTTVVDPAAEFEEFFGMRRRPDFATTDPLVWWRQHAVQFPHLSRLARDILSIPGSAVAVERVFSSGRDVISIRRSRLKPETISTLMLLKHKFRIEREHNRRRAQDDSESVL